MDTAPGADVDDLTMHPHETPAQRHRATTALDTQPVEGDSRGLRVAPMVDVPQRMAEAVVMEFRRRLTAGVYDAPGVLDTVAARLLESGGFVR